MDAIAQDRYGTADVLTLRQIDRPAAVDDRVLVRVRAAAVNPLDWHLMRGTPYLVRLGGEGFRRPKRRIRGADFAGVVEAVGTDVSGIEPGDRVFGDASGSFAEYVAPPAKNLAAMPSNLSFEQAAAVPVAGCTALQGLRDHAKIEAGHSVLINGAAGGVGTFAVQIGAVLGASVTGVCSTRNIDLVRSLGADRVVDYTREDFAADGQRYDAILDLIGNRSLRDLRRALKPKGTLIMSAGGAPRFSIAGPIAMFVKGMIVSRFVSQRIGTFLASTPSEDLTHLAKLIESGEVKPVIDRTYPLAQVPDAIRYVETGHARGKVIIAVSE